MVALQISLRWYNYAQFLTFIQLTHDEFFLDLFLYVWPSDLKSWKNIIHKVIIDCTSILNHLFWGNCCYIWNKVTLLFIDLLNLGWLFVCLVIENSYMTWLLNFLKIYSTFFLIKILRYINLPSCWFNGAFLLFRRMNYWNQCQFFIVHLVFRYIPFICNLGPIELIFLDSIELLIIQKSCLNLSVVIWIRYTFTF